MTFLRTSSRSISFYLSMISAQTLRVCREGKPAPTFPDHALTRAEPHAGAQKFLRVDRVAVDPRFIMQMRAGGAAGRADRADHLADLDGVADLDVDFGQMAVAGR